MTAPSKPWLTIIGISNEDPPPLNSQAQSALKSAHLLIGSKRQLALIPLNLSPKALREQWPSPLAPRIEELKQQKPKGTVIIATGDPLCWGIGETFTGGSHVSDAANNDITLIPAPSIISLVANQMHWPVTEIESLSLCSQPLACLSQMLTPHKKICVLSATNKDPQKVAEHLQSKGYGPSKISILQDLGTAKETRIDTTAHDLAERKERSQENPDTISNLNCLAIQLLAAPTIPPLTTNPGLRDDAFTHDGQLTKQHIRALTLMALRPTAHELLWDIGAGNGSISIEWARHHPSTKAIAIEPNQKRAANIKTNAEALGVPDLTIIEKTAPDCLNELKAPDAIFIGGGITYPGLLDTAIERLKPNGRLVANTVTLEGETTLINAQQQHSGTLTRFTIEQTTKLGKFRGWQAERPIVQWVYQKPINDEPS